MTTVSPRPRHMPGSYGSPVAPILDTQAGAKAIFFNPPPHTPASATARPGRHAVGADSFTTSKKRLRQDTSDSYFSARFSAGSDIWAHSAESIDRAGNTKSPPPLANEKYRLAGGSDTQLVLGKFQGEVDDYHNLGGQRRGYWDNTSTEPVMDGPSAPNGMSQSTLRNLISMMGGMAGKLVQFCAVPFRGFHAGGGHGYDIQGAVADSGRWEKQMSFNPELRAFRDSSTTLPGQFPEDNYGVLSMVSVDETPQRSSKRQCVDDREWVMIGGSGEDSRASSPRLSERRTPAITTSFSPSQIPRPVSRASMARGSGERPSRIPLSRRTSQARVSLVSNSGSPVVRRRASFVSPRPREYSRQSYGSPAMFHVQQTSPLPAESQRLINKVKRDEMEEELRLRKMSAQTKAMLKQARDALGSKFEVDDFDDDIDMEDEGFSEAPLKLRSRGKWDAR